ncbi:hypothetical protein FHS96_002304 [Sphingomonas zeicaulis]|uniref:hypothetical protein n=1 Tax=Sphingomonas zeicaulis TaxID=1632740 RepID=UPI003D197224
MLPMWVYIAVAALIAAVSFVIGQFVPGFGVSFVVLASTLWTVWSVRRHQRLSHPRC